MDIPVSRARPCGFIRRPTPSSSFSPTGCTLTEAKTSTTFAEPLRTLSRLPFPIYSKRPSAARAATNYLRFARLRAFVYAAIAVTHKLLCKMQRQSQAKTYLHRDPSPLRCFACFRDIKAEIMDVQQRLKLKHGRREPYEQKQSTDSGRRR